LEINTTVQASHLKNGNNQYRLIIRSGADDHGPLFKRGIDKYPGNEQAEDCDQALSNPDRNRFARHIAPLDADLCPLMWERAPRAGTAQVTGWGRVALSTSKMLRR
jgi:hypothetical protein